MSVLLDGASQPASKCYLNPACGDTVLNTGEDCDDGNTRKGDGCSANCTIELGYACRAGVRNSICNLIVVTNLSAFDTSTCPECSTNGQCVYYDRATYCLCRSGFLNNMFENPLVSRGQILESPHLCLDFDECYQRTHKCSPKAVSTCSYA